MFQSILAWLDNSRVAPVSAAEDRLAVGRLIPFLILHLSCLLVLVVGFSWQALLVGVVLYLMRMFGITAFYHRYFAHKSFRCPRWVAFLGAALGNSAVQRGPLWWAAHHRHHHRASDGANDLHSPAQQGFWHSHLLWIFRTTNFATQHADIKDFSKYFELRLLDRFDWLMPLLLALACFGLGGVWHSFDPKVTGLQMLVYGFILSTVACWHATFTINSLSHTWGSQPYQTGDDSRNNFILAVLTLGEGWHNNHHRYAASVRQGFRWYEIDLTYLGLRLAACCGLASHLKPVPAAILAERGQAAGTAASSSAAGTEAQPSQQRPHPARAA